MLTYNQIIKISRAFQQAHQVLKNFGNGGEWDKILHNQTATYKYPLMWMDDLPSAYSDGSETYSFRVSFSAPVVTLKDRDSDLMSTNVNEVKSDMIQCANSFIAYWVNQTNEFPDLVLEKSVQRTTFEDVTDDKLTGCYIDITFRQNFDYDVCGLPMGTPTPQPDTCAPVLIYENGVLVDTVSSGGVYSYTTGGTASIDITVNGQPFLDDQSTNVDIPIINSNADPVGTETPPGTIEIDDSQIQINDSAAAQLYLIDIPAEGVATQTITDSTVNVKDSAGTTLYAKTVKAQATADQIVSDSSVVVKKSNGATIHTVTVKAQNTADQIITDSTVNIKDSAGTLLYAKSVMAESSVDQAITDSTVVIKNTAGTTIQTETVKAQASKDATIANVSWTDSDGSSESTVYGGSIVCTPMINSATVYKSGAVTPILSEDDPSTQFGRGVDWYTLDYNNHFGTTRRFTGKTGGYQSGGSYFSVTGASTTYALAFPDDIVIDWAYWNKRTGAVHWWSMNYFSYTGTNALANQPYTLAGKSDWILPNIPMHRTLYNYEFLGLGTMMNYNPFNLAGLATANRLWLSNVPPVTTNLVNFSGADALTNNSLGTTCRVQAFRLGNTSEL